MTTNVTPVSEAVRSAECKKRLEKLKYEEFYLLDRKTDVKTGDHKFVISGSTKNVYTVTIYPRNSDVFCDCPDAKSWAKKYGCVCKHSLFILFRVLGVFDSIAAGFFQTLKFSADELDRIRLAIEYIDARVYNKELSDRYKLSSEPSKVTAVTKEFEEEDVCGICFLELVDAERATYTACPKCKNVAHTACLQKWLSCGHKSCVYCRQEVFRDAPSVGKDGYTNLQ